MKAHPTSFTPSNGASAPPLRSTTVLRNPASNRASPGVSSNAGGFDSIRLNTYHDSSDLKAALRELEAAFAVPESAPNAAATEGFFTSARATRSDAHAGRDVRPTPVRSTTVAEKPFASSGTQPVRTTIDTQTKSSAKGASASPSPSSSPPPLPSRKQKAGPAPLLQLPSPLLLRCFAFCDLKSLGVLCGVSVRLNVIVAQQGNALWAAAALRRRIPITNATASREELQRALTQQAQARHAEEAFYEDEIARMEERLRVRAADVYAQNVDVNRTIATGGGGGSSRGSNTQTAAAGGTAPPFWLRQTHASDNAVRDSTSGGMAEGETNSTTAQLCAKLLSEIETLQETKRLCECKVSLQETSLREQAAQLQQWQALLTNGSTSPALPSDAATSAPKTKAAGHSLVTAAQLDQFERRIARLVLNGGTVTTTATTNSASTQRADDEGMTDIPFVFRRGVEDFARLELVLRAMGVHTSSELSTAVDHHAEGQGGSFNACSNDHDSSVETVALKGNLPPLSAAVRAAARRWRAFQQVCPINEEYGNVRAYLKTQELRTSTQGVASGQLLSSDGGGGARPSTKQTPALLRVSGFVRRVEAMSDNQVLQAWM